MRANRHFPAILLAVFLSVPGSAFGDGNSPEAARDRMVLPEGFRAEIFAGEPMIRQPLSACFDERGRMWVIEYLQYPVPAGLKPVTVDQYLRTEYDRVPEPPPKGPRGADRIKILEDTDGDGRADKATIFVEGLNLASGLAVGHGGVFIGQAPYLLFFPDRNHDDKPDGDPEVLLTGFGLQDAHSTVNSMAWGPDGWLYGAQGSTVTAKIRGIGFQQGIWRYHPTSRVFELFAEGGGNTWGLDWDQSGNAFGSSNGGFITFHNVQGGYYWKGFAKHGPLHNPRTYGYFDSIAYDGPKSGGHVTPGGIIYKGDAYPESFNGRFIGGNLLSNAVYWHELRSDGSTFRGKHGGTLIDARDPWFRPIDLTVGPDGCVYVVDWYDRRASHLDPRDNWDKTNGRIYRIAYKERKALAPFDLGKRSSDALVDLRTSRNDWQAEIARRILAERRDPTVVPRLKSLLNADRDPVLSLRDLWALNASGGLDDETALGLLSHPVGPVRAWTVRLLGDGRRMNPSLAASLRHLAESDADPMVRSQLASSTSRWKAAEALPIVEALLGRSEDLNDRFIPLQLWWTCEHHIATEHDLTLVWSTRPEVQKSVIFRSTILDRLARLLVSTTSEADDLAAAKLLEGTTSEAETDRVVAGLLKGLEGRKPTAVPKSFTQGLERLRSGTSKLDRMILALRLGDASAFDLALKRLSDPKEADPARVALIEVIGQLGRVDAAPVLIEVIRHEPKPNIVVAAIAAIGAFDRPEIGDALLSRYPNASASTQSRIIDVLVSRKTWANRLTDAMAAGRVSPKDVKAGQILQAVQHRDPALNARLEKVWGRVPGPGSPEKIRRIAEIRGMLPEGDKGNAARGQLVFKEHCATCHKLFGEGENIGPELTGSERGSLDFLLASLVDPSALIRKEYEARSIALNDGRVVTGLVLEENDKTISLIDSKRQKTVIAVKDVEESKPSPVSLMPEGVLDTLREEQIRDLYRYLQSSGPPAKPSR